MNVNLLQAVGDLGDYPGVWTDRKVFTFLAEHSNSKGTVSVSQSVIARETGISQSTVYVSVHRLEDKGFLTVEKTTTECGGTASNIYHISPWYLVHTKTAKRATKPQCAACVEPGEYHKVIPDYYAGNGVSYASHTTINPQLNTNDMRRFARLGVVLADVVKDIFALYEEKSSK